jgi:hypothetical protein
VGGGEPFFLSLRESRADDNIPNFLEAGLPDGTFAYTNYRSGYILEGLGMENVGISHGRLVYFTAVRHSLWSLGIKSPVFVLCKKKNLATLLGSQPPAQGRKKQTDGQIDRQTEGQGCVVVIHHVCLFAGLELLILP